MRGLPATRLTQLYPNSWDRVIKHLASVIQKNCREKDSPARVGGEEFSILLSEIDIGNACKVMERMRVMFMETPIISNEGQVIFCTVSIGIASYTSQEDANQVLADADIALYKAKHSGRNQVVRG